VPLVTSLYPCALQCLCRRWLPLLFSAGVDSVPFVTVVGDVPPDVVPDPLGFCPSPLSEDELRALSEFYAASASLVFTAPCAFAGDVQLELDLLSAAMEQQ